MCQLIKVGTWDLGPEAGPDRDRTPGHSPQAGPGGPESKYCILHISTTASKQAGYQET